MKPLELPYEVMVDRLWKHEALPQMYHHCAVGIVGEVIELMEAEQRFASHRDNRDHVLEELGDLTFFVTRALLWNNLHLEMYTDLPKELDSNLLFDAGELLDCSKRFFVYERSLDEDRWGRHLTRVAICLHSKFRLYGYHLHAVQFANAEKLLTGEKARFKLGTFTTEQAEARADKVA